MFQEQAPSCVLKFTLQERVSGASSLVCTGWGTYPGAYFGSVFKEQAPSCVLVGVLTRERVSGACFGSVFREQAPSCVLALTPLGNNNMNFRLSRDQVVLLETAANL